jgi:quercetin dioxygenase-like cupin family protein
MDSNEMTWTDAKYGGRLKRKRVYVGDVSLSITVISPGKEGLPIHSHRPLQIGYVLDGEIEFTVGERREKVLVKKGGFFGFDSELLHGAKVVGDREVVFIDLYYPISPEHRMGSYKLGRTDGEAPPLQQSEQTLGSHELP